MKILFVRHGESQDDLDNRYGGWQDYTLTDGGKELIKSRIAAIKDLNQSFEIVLSSPLSRALESAKILGEGLNLSVEVLEYAKEINTYGILSGMEKGEAKKKYPDQVEKLDTGEFVDGSERDEDRITRVKKCLELLQTTGHQTVIVVTHGTFLKTLCTILGKKLLKKEDGGFVLLEFIGETVQILAMNGIEIE